MYLHAHVCLYESTHTHLDINLHIHIHTHVFVNIHACLNLHMYLHAHVCLYVSSHTHPHIRMYIHINTHAHPIPLRVTFSNAVSKRKAQISNVSFHRNIATETLELWALSFRKCFELWAPQVGLAVFVNIHACLNNLQMYLHAHVCLYVSTHTCLEIHLHMNIYTRICTWKSTTYLLCAGICV